MSRPPLAQSASLDASQAELEEEEAISGTGEGDEVMEEAEEQEGYSAYQLLDRRQGTLPAAQTSLRVPANEPALITVMRSLIDADIDADLDQLVLLAARPRILLRSIRGFHRGRLQPHWPERDGALLEGGDGDGAGCRAGCVSLRVDLGYRALI